MRGFPLKRAGASSPENRSAFFIKHILFDLCVIWCSALRSKVRDGVWELLSADEARNDDCKVGFFNL